MVYAVYLYFNQSNYIYFPSSYIYTTPSDLDLFYEDIMLKNSDGIRISAWYIPVKNPRATILFFHGNGGNISHQMEYIKMFYSLDLSTFLIDYCGYGKSEGAPTEKGTYLDSEAAWDYLMKEKNIIPSNIVIYGNSLGGPIAARLAEKKNPAALILDSTFISIKDIAVKLYPYLPVRKFLKFEYNTLGYLKGVVCPTLVIHSTDDDYIPFSHAEKLLDAIDGKKKLVETKGGHNTGLMVSNQIYKNSIDNLIKGLKKPD